MTERDVVDQVDLGDHVCWAQDDGTHGLDAAGRFVHALCDLVLVDSTAAGTTVRLHMRRDTEAPVP